MSFLTAAFDRSSSGPSGAVSDTSFSGVSSACGVALMLLAMGLQPAFGSRSCRVGDTLKGWLRLSKTSGVEEPINPMLIHVGAVVWSDRYSCCQTGECFSRHIEEKHANPSNYALVVLKRGRRVANTANPTPTMPCWTARPAL